MGSDAKRRSVRSKLVASGTPGDYSEEKEVDSIRIRDYYTMGYAKAEENALDKEEIKILREEINKLQHENYSLGMKLESVEARAVVYCLLVGIGFVLFTFLIQYILK